MRRRSMLRSLMGGLGLCAALLLVEGAARVAEPVLPQWRGPDNTAVLMTGHPTRLWGMAPGTRFNAGPNASINELGLRGPMVELPRPAGRTRLMVLGDSSFFGHGVADGQDLGSVAVGLLPDADLVIGAVPGYSVAQSKVFLDEEGWDLQPSVLVIGHLWSDNTWDAFHDEDLLASAAFNQRNPLAHSRALRMAATLFGGGAADGGRIITVSKLEPWPEGRVRRVPLKRYAALLDELLLEAADREVGALFILPANRISLTGAFAHWDPYYQVMREIAAHHGLPLLDANALYADIEPDTLFLDSMHPTVTGHQILGQALAQELAGGLSVPTHTPFDRSHIEDILPPDHFSDRGVGSPQRSLFDATPTEPDAAPDGPPQAP